MDSRNAEIFVKKDHGVLRSCLEYESDVKSSSTLNDFLSFNENVDIFETTIGLSIQSVRAVLLFYTHSSPL